MIESYIGDLYHLDLRMTREDKVEHFYVKPGEDNLWYLLAITA